MKEKVVNKTLNFLLKNGNYSKSDREKLKYGIEGIYLTITKCIIIFLLAFLLRMFKEEILLLLCFNILRFTGFGFHADSSLKCLIFSTILFILIPYVFININIDFPVIILLDILGIIYLSIYAPSDTVKRPLPNKKKRILRKLCTIINSSLFLIISFFTSKDISIILMLSIICECVMVSPITYKIFKMPYRNYLKMKEVAK